LSQLEADESVEPESVASNSGQAEWWRSEPVSTEVAAAGQASRSSTEPQSKASSAVETTSSEAAENGPVLLGEKLQMAPPSNWVRKRPRVRIIEAEFAVPAAEADKQDGRVTVMAAGGTVKANIERWQGQFTQPDGSDTKDHATLEEMTVAGRKVHLVDVSGTYRDQRGPFAPAVERPGYRMLAAIVETGDANYFVKFYGPAKTVSAQAEAFRAMIRGMEER
jgi:hypothetical protein